MQNACVYVCARVCVCVRESVCARARVCMCMCVSKSMDMYALITQRQIPHRDTHHNYTNSRHVHSSKMHAYVCVRVCV